MPPLTRQEQRDREEFVNRYMRENPDADDVEAEDLWEDRRSGDGADGVDDGPEEPLPQSEAQPVRDEGANEPTAPAAPTSPSAPPTGGPESAPTPAPPQPPADPEKREAILASMRVHAKARYAADPECRRKIRDYARARRADPEGRARERKRQRRELVGIGYRKELPVLYAAQT